jgi:hypothetical protein
MIKKLHWEPLVVIIVAGVTARLFESRYRFVSQEAGYAEFVIALILALAVLVLSTNRAWHRIETGAVLAFCVFLTYIACVATAHIVSFALTHRAGEVDGLRLIVSVIWVWMLNVLTFAVWYWQLDSGGPHGRDTLGRGKLDLLFTPMTLPELGSWKPSFLSYVFFSFCTSTAFGPADTVPLTDRAKVLMMAESLMSLTILTVVASRAIGLLS